MCVCTRRRYNPRLYVDMYTVHTHHYICIQIYVHSHAELYMQRSTHTYTYTHTQHTHTNICMYMGRALQNAETEKWLSGLVRVDQRWRLTTSRALSIYLIPPERVSSLSPFPARPRVSILRPREPLFLHSNRFRSRCDILLESCHVRASRI